MESTGNNSEAEIGIHNDDNAPSIREYSLSPQPSSSINKDAKKRKKSSSREVGMMAFVNSTHSESEQVLMRVDQIETTESNRN